jgi:Subtilase family
MHPGTAAHRWVGASSAALALAGVLVAAAAAEAAIVPGGGVLSPRLAELAKPSVRNSPPAEQARKLSLAPKGPGSLLRYGSRVLAEVRFDHGAAAGVEDLRAAGSEVVSTSVRYQTVTVAVRPDELRQLSRVPRIVSVREVLTPITAASTCPSGKAVSEGLTQLRAGEAPGEARKLFPGITGAGVRVGILSDSFNTAAESVEGGEVATHEEEDVESGDLPGPANSCEGEQTAVDVLEDYEPASEEEPEPADEGRAMAQIVHDLAPEADISFATAFTGITGFAANVEALAAAGAKVIADDVTYFEEPFFQEGPVGAAATKVTEEDGVSYFSAAGNDNLVEAGTGNDIASWEAPQFRDSGGCPAAIVAFEEEIGTPLHPTHCMDFNPGPAIDRTFGITVEAGETLMVDLQWAEPWEGVHTDLDAFLIGPEGSVVEASGEDNPADGRPFEFLSWENESGTPAQVQLVINRFSGGNPRLKFALLENGGGVASTEYPRSSGGDIVGPTIFGHSGGEDVTSVAAIPYFSTTAPEPYSSRGPVTHYFGPVSGGTPAAPLASPQILSKPDVTATDCGVTTFFAQFGPFLPKEASAWHFCGTSAATPHAAAVAALMRQEKKEASPEEIHKALVESATPIGAFGPCAVGAGLVDAVGALELISSGASGKSPASCLPPESEPLVEPEGAQPIPSVAAGPARVPVATQKKRKAPLAFFKKHPRSAIRTPSRSARVVFQFGADQPVTFLCDIDSGPFHPCPTRFAHRFGLGRHTVRVKARSTTGGVDKTPAVFRFRVKQRRRDA